MTPPDFNIIAVDFDGTLCADLYPGIGAPNQRLIFVLKQLKARGAKLILWTCRCGEPLSEAVGWCKKHGLTFDAVNENLPEVLEKYGTDSRKITADLYIDDKGFNAGYGFPDLLSSFEETAAPAC